MLENKTVPFSFVKAGVFYFTRRVPKDLDHHYTTGKISFSLRTRSKAVAKSRAQRTAQQLDEHWYHLRIQDVDLPGKHLLRMGAAAEFGSSMSCTDQASVNAVKLSEAVSVYLQLKGQGRPITFHRAAERSCGDVLDVCGDKDIRSYAKADANAFRGELVKRELAGSRITRIFGTVRSVINFAASEAGITLTNPFAGVYYDRSAGVEDREPMPIEAILSLQSKCRSLDDDLRWLVALVSDTGMRLAEAAGLLKEDFELNDPVPHVVVQAPPLPAHAHFDFRSIFLNPPIDCVMIKLNPTLRHHGFQITIADPVPTIPMYGPQNHLTSEMTPFEIIHIKAFRSALPSSLSIQT